MSMKTGCEERKKKNTHRHCPFNSSLLVSCSQSQACSVIVHGVNKEMWRCKQQLLKKTIAQLLPAFAINGDDGVIIGCFQGR